MAGIITADQLINMGLDANSWEKYWEGESNEDVVTRLEKTYPTHAKALKIMAETGGYVPFLTDAERAASTSTLPRLIAKVKETGKIWWWNRTSADGVTPITGTWTDTGLSELDQAKEYVRPSIGDLKRLDSKFYYDKGDGKVTLESNASLFAVSVDVAKNDCFILNTQTFGVVGAYYIVDSNNSIIEYMTASEASKQSYLLKMPANASKLYASCTYEYSSSFSLSKVPSGVLDLLYINKNVQQFTYYSSPNGVITKSSNKGLFAKEFIVSAGDYYLINTKTFGSAGEFYIADSNGNVLQSQDATDGTFGSYLFKMPANAAKLYVNCAYSSSDIFSVQKISSKQLTMMQCDEKKEDFTFYYAPSGIFKKEKNTGLFAISVNVAANEHFCISTGSFGVAYEYMITDSSNNILATKAATGSLSDDYIITMPANAAKLYVNCAYTNKDRFSVTKISNTIYNKISSVDSTVRSVFPSVNYFDQLRLKCPNFYKKFKNKTEDVCVVLYGTSLTQGNLYATDRSDATTRPPCMHTNDFASAVFDKLIKHWDGQKYRRYDHADLTYSSSDWSVVTQVLSNSADVWDDFTYRKNGLTKTTTSASASVSMTIPTNAWQFNFIHRTDSQGGSCTVAIAEGNSKVEVWNGTAWVEANGYVFSMLEPAVTSKKGNTQYQKRLKMRCKNKASGGINSIGSTKQITITKANDATRFNVVGFEWTQREFMLSVINSSRGGHHWDNDSVLNLANYQDGDVWAFNPDLLLSEITIINWSASEASAMSVDPLVYVNKTKRAYFNEFNDFDNSLIKTSENFTKCDVIFYSDTLAATSAVSGAYDSTTHEPLFGTVTDAATNGSSVDASNVGRTKTNFENYEAVEQYVSSKGYFFIPVLSTFKSVAEKYYGSYWDGMQASGKTGTTLSYDGVHYNDNGAALFARIIASVFDNL